MARNEIKSLSETINSIFEMIPTNAPEYGELFECIEKYADVFTWDAATEDRIGLRDAIESAISIGYGTETGEVRSVWCDALDALIVFTGDAGQFRQSLREIRKRYAKRMSVEEANKEQDKAQRAYLIRITVKGGEKAPDIEQLRVLLESTLSKQDRDEFDINIEKIEADANGSEQA